MTKPSVLSLSRRVSTYKILNSTSSNHAPLCFHHSYSFIPTEYSFTFMTTTCSFTFLCFPLRPHYSIVWTQLEFLVCLFFKVMLSTVSIWYSLPSLPWTCCIFSWNFPLLSDLSSFTLFFVDLQPSSVSSGFKGTEGHIDWDAICLSLSSYSLASWCISSPLLGSHTHIYRTSPGLSSFFCCFCSSLMLKDL